MLQIALKGVRNNPFRYVATSLAIIVGIAFFVTTSVITGSFRDSLNSALEDAFSDIDAAVESTETISFGPISFAQPVPAETAALFQQVDGVTAAEPLVQQYAQVLDADGKQVTGTQAWTGTVWIDNPNLNLYDLVNGKAPAAADELVLDINTFERGNFEIGQTVTVDPAPVDGGDFTLVGVFEVGSTSAAFEEITAFTLEGAQRVMQSTDAQIIAIDGDDSLTSDQLLANINAEIENLDAPLTVRTGTEFAESFGEAIGVFTTFIDYALKIFASIALFVGAFVIYNTFSIIIAQRTKEMALLRAIGASGRQVSTSVLVEAIIVGLLASFVGVLAGIGFAFVLLMLLNSFFGELGFALSIPVGGVIFSLLLGTLITVGAAWLPARRGARVAPIEALRDSEIEEVGAGRARRVIGVGGVVIGLLLSLAGVDVFGDMSAWLLALGAPILLVSIVLIAPVIVRPVTRVLALPLTRNGQITGELARENAVRNPKRTATTSLTLMIGVALMVTAAVFATTFRSTVQGTLDETITATDLVVVNPNVAQTGGGLDPAIGDAIAAVDGVETVVPFRILAATVAGDGGFTAIGATDTENLSKVVNVAQPSGTVNNLGAGEVALDQSYASQNDYQLGDSFQVATLFGNVDLTVAGIFEDDDALQVQMLVDLATVDPLSERPLDSQLFIVSNGDAASAIEAELAGVPTAELKSKTDYIEDRAGQIAIVLYMLYGLLGMAVFVALIGIVNTMALSIHERTRELGLLRAVGMTQRQLKRSVRYESGLVALMGTLVGIALGLLFGWLAYKAGEDNLLGFELPWSQIVVVVVVGITAGMLAGVLPARRAAKLNVLKAIATE